MLCGDTSHTADKCPLVPEFDGQFENEHHHKIARELARQEAENSHGGCSEVRGIVKED